VRAIDIASYLGYTKPSVSRALGILKKNDYILVDNNGYVSVTQKGKQIAEELYERHTVLSNMLIWLGVDKDKATDDACRIEHVISDESFSAIKNHFKNFKK
jgi:Mn-dependent DtxR family transcriptional regulator